MANNTENSVPAGHSAYEVSQGKETPVNVQMKRAENGLCVWCGKDCWGAPEGWVPHNHGTIKVPEEVEDGYVCCLCYQKEEGYCSEKYKYGPRNK